MNNFQLLQGKHALIFGAGGSIGSAVAEAFAAEGAEVFLSGRTQSKLDEVARRITANGGRARTQILDALDDSSVNAYVAGLAKQVGTLDVVFNAVGPLISEYANCVPAVDLNIEQFMVPVNTVLKSQFITGRAAARQMVKQRSGTIIFLTGSPARGHVPGATAIGAAFGAIENLTENLAVEVSPAGVRVVCLRSTANVDSRTIVQTAEVMARAMGGTPEQMMDRLASANFLKTRASVRDTARAAVLIASDYGRLMTGTTLNSTAGAAAD